MFTKIIGWVWMLTSFAGKYANKLTGLKFSAWEPRRRDWYTTQCYHPWPGAQQRPPIGLRIATSEERSIAASYTNTGKS